MLPAIPDHVELEYVRFVDTRCLSAKPHVFSGPDPEFVYIPKQEL